MSLVFQNIDPTPPSPPGECVPPPPTKAERGVGGSIFWKTRDIGLPSYSNYLSTIMMMMIIIGLYLYRGSLPQDLNFL
jgi:hypothetical protein